MIPDYQELLAALEWMARSPKAVIVYPDGIDTGIQDFADRSHDGTGLSIAAALIATHKAVENLP